MNATSIVKGIALLALFGLLVLLAGRILARAGKAAALNSPL